MSTDNPSSRYVSCRKILLLHRAPFLHAWDAHFPAHDVVTTRMKRYPLDTFERACDRAEMEAAKRPVDAATKRARRLLEDDVSLDRAWRELNDARRRPPTPQVVVEAIWHCVRERGLSALDEPVNLERLRRCDAMTLAQIDARVAKLKGSRR
jgi:hypothetical protein